MSTPPPFPPTDGPDEPSDHGQGSPPPGDRPGSPAPIVLTSEQRGWGAAAHLSAFVGAWALVGVIGPLVVYVLRKDEDPFTAYHAREAMNFNLTLLVLGAVALVFTFFTLGLGIVVVAPLAIVYGIVWLVATVLGAVKAWDGQSYRYPLTIRFVR